MLFRGTNTEPCEVREAIVTSILSQHGTKISNHFENDDYCGLVCGPNVFYFYTDRFKHVLRTAQSGGMEDHALLKVLYYASPTCLQDINTTIENCEMKWRK